MYYFVPPYLQNTLKELANKFESEGGFVCLRAVEPAPSEGQEVPNIRTGITAQQGEILITENCKGFVLEGNLEEFGYRELAISIGCIEFENATEYINFEKELLKN